MQDRRKVKTKKKEKRPGDDRKPTKEEYAVAKHLRFKCATKQATLFGTGDQVNYFIGSKAVECLMDSPWASTKKKTETLLASREACVAYLQGLLEKGLFHRAKKLVQRQREKVKETDGEKPKKLLDSPSTVKKDAKTPAVKKAGEEDDDKDKEKDSKKKRKVKLDFHTEQKFLDGNDVYIWEYDPTSPKAFIIGLVIVIGSIALCLFPLWPPEVRLGVYYLSMAAMGFVGVIVVLAILRAIMFGVIWACTMGRHHFWLLPNLTEDCGFFESFKPFYSHKYMPPGGSKKTEEESTVAEADEDRKSGVDEVPTEAVKKGTEVDDGSSQSEAESDDARQEQNISRSSSQDSHSQNDFEMLNDGESGQQ